MLKLKGSYGKVGNDNIGGNRRWAYESSIVAGGSWNYGNTGGNGGSSLITGEVENLTVSWEEAKKLNAGVEFSLFNKVKSTGRFISVKNVSGIFLQRAGLPAL